METKMFTSAKRMAKNKIIAENTSIMPRNISLILRGKIIFLPRRKEQDCISSVTFHSIYLKLSANVKTKQKSYCTSVVLVL